MFYDLVIVLVGSNPIKMEGLAGTICDRYIDTLMKGEWLTLKPKPGVVIQINPANVAVLDKRPQTANQVQDPAKFEFQA